MTAPWVDVLAKVVAGAPSLPGAKCRGRSHLFDERQPDEPADVANDRHAQAAGLCQRCPARDRCTEWVASLPASKRPSGVIAGRRPRPAGRPKAQPSTERTTP